MTSGVISTMEFFHFCIYDVDECSGFVRTMTDPCCNATYYTNVVVFWFDLDGLGGGGDWGWYVPEGGGGGGGTPCPGCNWDDTNPCEEQDPNQPQFPCDQDWQPTVSAVKEPFHLNEYDDTIGIGNGLENVYPCMASFIRDSFANINSDPHSNVNYLAQLAGADVFGDSAYMHLTFDTSTVLTHQGQAAAGTFDTLIAIDPSGNTHFYATIKFNGWYLRNGTREYKVARILHEVMHAIFGLRWKQYQVWLNTNPHQGTIDSNFIKEHFPINWYWMTQQNVPLTELQDHEIMATDYASFFTSIGSKFYNPAAPSYIRDTVLKALGYGGLRATSAWKMLPSFGIDTCKYRNINLTAAESFIGTTNVSGCASFTTHFADSLKMRSGCN